MRADCQSAQSTLDDRWWNLLNNSVERVRLGAVPDEVFTECEGLSVALLEGDVDAAFTLERLRRCDGRQCRWVLEDISAVMREANYDVPMFDE